MQKPLEGHKPREPFVVRLRLNFRLAEFFRVVQIQVNETHQPQDGVQAKEGKGADEQAGHAQKHRVEQRIMLCVHGIGVRLVFGELYGGAGMTLLAGGQNVGFRKMRAQIRRRQDIMVTMTVITGGHRRCRVRFAQRHGLAVISVAVARQAVFVAFAAALVADGFEIISLRIDDFMRGVAVRADRPARIAFGQQLPVNALVVGLLDAVMAFAAGLGDVGVVDGRIAVHGALDVMDAVTVVARGRDNQPHLQQRLPVDAVQILRRGLRVLDLIFLHQPRIAVTFGAGLGQVELEDRRRRIRHRQNAVRTVAVPAIGRARRAHRMAHAVDARGVILGFFLVAAGTIRRRQVGVVNQFLHAGVAIGAVQRAVNGFLKAVRRENRKRNLDSIHHAGVVGIRVAIETIRVRQLLDGIGPRRRGRCSQAEKQPAA